VSDGAAVPPAALTAGEAAALVEGELQAGDPRTALRGTTIDSRTVAPGMLFVALAGTRTDGHRFVGDAFQRHAAGVLVSRPPEGAPPGAVVIRVRDTLRAFHRLARGARDRQKLRVVGITGSVGKTSTKEMAAAVAARAFRTARSPETWNTEIGIPLVLTNMPEDREVAVLELAMRGPGQIRELVEICAPDIGVVTNIGESHMDFFPSREALAAEKGALIEGLPPSGVAILNADDPLVAALGGRTRARVLTFGCERGEVRAEALRVLPLRGSTFRLRTPEGGAHVALRVPGRHSVWNALAAAAVGVALGLRAEAIADGLRDAVPLPMRLELIRLGRVTLLNDVYNSSPQSVATALDALEEIEGSPRVAVLGDMKELGARSVEAHRRVGGDAARRRFDLVVAFGPLAAELAVGAREVDGPRVVHTNDVENVVALLQRELVPGSVALIKGSRAMAMERITAALVRPEPTGAVGRGGGA
jgi:UDP-N-acetylmuramoyl-tripeptide--D-alanyl-D-alanine ligase